MDPTPEKHHAESIRVPEHDLLTNPLPNQVPRSAQAGEAQSEARASEQEPGKDELEKQAAYWRDCLDKTLDGLSQKKQRTIETARRVVTEAKHSLPMALATTGSFLAVLGGAGYLIHRSRHSLKHQVAKQLRPLTRFLEPAVDAVHLPRRSVGSEIFREVLVSVSTYALARATEVGIGKLLPKLEGAQRDPHAHAAPI